MPAAVWGNVSRQRLRENITLLWTLTETPERPKENQFPELASNTRFLSFEREKEIVDNLAFLSAFEDDPLKVMAVCVQEDTNHDRLIIQLASNTGDLQEVRHGFNNIAKVLEQAALRVNSKTDDIETLFRQVVILDYARILSRLRSKHAKRTRKTAGRPALLPQLNTAVHDQSIKANGPVMEREIEEIRTRTTELEALFLRLEDKAGNHATSSAIQDVIMAIVQQAQELIETTRLEKTLETYQTNNLELKKSLPERVGKVGRYYSASRHLVCAARSTKYSIFRSVQIEICQISMFKQSLPSPSVVPSIVAILQRLEGGKRQPKGLGELITTYTKKPLSSIEKTFRERLIAGTTTSRVHAEIQLLFYYELHPEIRRPRVISSSKSACYLCDLFIRSHGIFYTPRTHGRLYDKWTLPNTEAGVPTARRKVLNAVLDQFNSVLEQKIRSTISAKRRMCYHPNESVLVPSAYWSASTLPINPLSSAAASAATLHVNQMHHEDVAEPSIDAGYSLPPEDVLPKASLVAKPLGSPQTILDTAITTAKITPFTANLLSPRPTHKADRQVSEGNIEPNRASNVDSSAYNPLPHNPAKPSSSHDRLSLDETTPLSGLSFGEKYALFEEVQPIDEPKWQELPDPFRSPLEANIGKLHLVLSRESSSQDKHLPVGRVSLTTLVQVRKLDRDEDPLEVVKGGSSNLVDIENTAPGEDFIVEQEGMNVLMRLYLKYGQDIIAIEYKST